MTVTAVISDVHGNLEALDAVLQDAFQMGAQRVICLGDLIGYGPDPVECIKAAMSWPLVLRGQFEDAFLLNDDLPFWTAEAARQTVLAFRRTLESHSDRAPILAFLAQLTGAARCDGVQYVHGTTAHPINGILYPQDSSESDKMNEIASRFDRLCFCGRTHIPGIFFQADCGDWHSLSPDQLDHCLQLDRAKVVCNVGSVGQPCDGNPKASYVLHCDDSLVFRRVAYDITVTAKKMRGQGFDEFLVQRLMRGI